MVVGVVLVATLAAAGAPSTANAQANVTGQWQQLSYTTPINPIHASLLRSGKVLVVAGSENDPTHTTYRAALWDPVAANFAVQNIPWDLFCNAMSFLPDGRVLITGGTGAYNPFVGIKTTTIFDPATEGFIQVQDMARGRWYPSNALLSDGKTMTFSGWLDTGGPNNAVELYDVPTGWSPEFGAPWSPTLYPWLHLLPSGQVFFAGSTPGSRIFDPATKTWSAIMATTLYNQDRHYGSSVLLPLRPDDGYRARVMIMGGNNPATDTVEVIDLSAAAPAWRGLPSMSAPRVEMSAVILPTGKVLALGGSAIDNDAGTAALGADLFDPVSETWASAGRGAMPRLYHSVALLLPDATVWVAGPNPTQGTWENRMEIYSPAYLFTTDAAGNTVAATRPTIGGAPARVGYGASFQVQTPNAADVATVVFVRPGSSTHAFNFDQRLVGLSFTAGAGALTVTAPPNSNIAPPGYYMLFLLDKKGVPSVAKFVQLAANPANQPPKGTITNPTADVTITAGQSVTFAGDGTDADGSVAKFSWVFPGGSPMTSTAATPGTVTFSTAGTYVASLTVTDNLGDNDPSPPTRTITVQPSGGGGPPPPPPPTGTLGVSMTSPVNGETVFGTTPVNIWVGPAGTPPYTYTIAAAGTTLGTQSSSLTHVTPGWDTTKTPGGAQTLTATVTDANGQTGSASVNVTVKNGTAPPPTSLGASFTSPAAGATVSGTAVTIGMTSSGAAAGNISYKLAIDGAVVAVQTTTATSVSYSWDTTTYSNGAHALSLTVTDSTSATASATRSVTVSTGPPAFTVSTTSPTVGSTISGTSWVNIWLGPGATPPYSYTMSAAGATVWTESSSNTHVTLPWDTTKTPDGAQTLMINVRDVNGKTGSATLSVTVQNGTAPPPPSPALSASFTSPAAGATVSGTVSVGMSASGGSPAYTYALTVDTTQVFTTSSAATSTTFNWDTATVASGPHTLGLKVTDSTGATATASRSVTVGTGGGGTLNIGLTSPLSNETVFGTTWVNVWVGTPVGKPPYTFTLSVGATTVWTESSSNVHVTLPWDTTQTPNGAQTLKATVKDSTGATGAATVNVTVQNP